MFFPIFRIEEFKFGDIPPLLQSGRITFYNVDSLLDSGLIKIKGSPLLVNDFQAVINYSEDKAKLILSPKSKVEKYLKGKKNVWFMVLRGNEIFFYRNISSENLEKVENLEEHYVSITVKIKDCLPGLIR